MHNNGYGFCPYLRQVRFPFYANEKGQFFQGRRERCRHAWLIAASIDAIPAIRFEIYRIQTMQTVG